MNYLAHAFLSFHRPGILVGNMISDYVKGKKRYQFPAGIQEGITLHREIDRFTDQHPACREARKVFRPAYRLYSGAVVDVVLDHFLAIDVTQFATGELEGFSRKTYSILDQFTPLFPDQFGLMYPYMKAQNWLFNYRHLSGIRQSLRGLIRRARYLDESDTAYDLLIAHFDQLRECYRAFIPEVKKLALDYLDHLDEDESDSVRIMNN